MRPEVEILRDGFYMGETITHRTMSNTFSTIRRYEVSPSFIPYAVDAVRDAFKAEGFEFSSKSDSFNRTVVNVVKGGLVKLVAGLRQGLEIVFEKDGCEVVVTVRASVLKDQIIAGYLSLFVVPPLLISQIVGLIRQSGLDDKAVGIVDTAHAKYCFERPSFCTHCGGRLTGDPERCPHCGARL